MHKYSAVLTQGKILFDRIAASAEVQTGSEPFSMVASNGQRVPAWVLKILPKTLDINRRCKCFFAGVEWKWFSLKKSCGFCWALLHLRECLVNKITAEGSPLS